MKVTFVYPDVLDCVSGYQGAYYAGIASLSAVLKQASHSTSLLHIVSPDYGPSDFLRDLREHRPDLIAFSSVKNGAALVQRLAASLSGNGIATPTIYGGIHPTLCPEECINYPGIGMICVGEGEGAILDVVQAIAGGKGLDSIPNVWIKKSSGEVIRNPLRPLIADLDALPFPDRGLFDYPNMHNEKSGILTLMGSRGCPYGCVYCANRALIATYKGCGTYVRFRSPGNIAEEINQARANYPFVTRVQFDDDILFMDKAWGREFARVFAEKVGLPFCSNVYPRLVDEELIDLLAQAGCDELRIGLESGNEWIRKEVLQRELDEDVIIRAFHTARKHGIRTMSFNMIGLPYENASAVLDTIKLNAKAGVDNIQHTVFHPYPGTPLAELVEEKGWLSDRVNTSYYQDSVLNLPTLTGDQIHMFQKYFYTLVDAYRFIYRLPKWIGKSVEHALDFLASRKSAPKAFALIRPLVHAVRKIAK